MMQLVGMWVALLTLIYFLPSATRPDREERRLQAELIALEKEVKELAEDLQELAPRKKKSDKDRPPESKKAR